MPQMPNIIVQLVHIQGPLKGQIQDFSQFPVQIGRHSSCQVRFEKDLTTISRRHARIERQGNRFRIIDASTNGTYVNGKRIADVYLRDGDVITFSENGPKASFLTKIEAGEAPIPHTRPAQPVPPSPVSAVPPQMSAASPVRAPEIPSTPPPHIPEPGLTVGPGLEIPVISTNAPLVIQFGPTLQSYNLLPVTIGTDPACDFVMANNALAGRHLQIFFNENEYYAKDLTGRSTVSINGRPVGTQSVLAQGAELSLTDRGPKFRFLGGGRLAEIQDVVSDPLEKTDADANLRGANSEPSVPQKKSKSLFKSFFS
ncbi:FHA domain-containing protein [uncultured Desulfosarcina sp.]|uniref:FHA domain-containing protein n=1 Tax=uncultured Desulfosarcina sp. TaxID=218289 RepID=UPI0029C87E5C|nr:FHA domain-containing protein [uncultured Desulfosarcina sp.]